MNKLLGSLLCTNSIFLGLDDDELSRFRQKSIAVWMYLNLWIYHIWSWADCLHFYPWWYQFLIFLLLIMLRSKYFCWFSGALFKNKEQAFNILWYSKFGGGPQVDVSCISQDLYLTQFQVLACKQVSYIPNTIAFGQLLFVCLSFLGVMIWL